MKKKQRKNYEAACKATKWGMEWRGWGLGAENFKKIAEAADIYGDWFISAQKDGHGNPQVVLRTKGMR